MPGKGRGDHTMADQLEHVAEDWETALAIVAHPDDLEYGAAAAVARWTGQGKRVAYCLATSGEAGIDDLPPEECGTVREAEERAGAALVGVTEVEFLGFPDGTLEYGLPLRRAFAAAMRRHRPDVLITISHHESWGPGTANQADHIVTGRAVIDAARDAGNRWVFRDLAGAGLEPWKVRHVLINASPQAGHAVDVTGTFDRGVASLAAHQEYLRGLGEHGDPAGFLTQLARSAGERLGTGYAATFEVIGV
jgi:LmbE family N-acetylglucosaminyl deacetylase